MQIDFRLFIVFRVPSYSTNSLDNFYYFDWLIRKVLKQIHQACANMEFFFGSIKVVEAVVIRQIFSEQAPEISTSV